MRHGAVDLFITPHMQQRGCIASSCGDGNLNGLVNGSDFNVLVANFNQGVSGADVSGGDILALDAFAAANGLKVRCSTC